MDFTDVPMLKIWPILADTNTDINSASLDKIGFLMADHIHTYILIIFVHMYVCAAVVKNQLLQVH